MKLKLLAFTLLSVSMTNYSQVTLTNSYENNTSDNIGSFQGITFREGGFSSLVYIPGTNGTEFWTVTDRGVNIDAANANTSATTTPQYPNGCVPTYDKIYAFPTYAPKLMHIKILNNEVTVLETIAIKRPNGQPVTGLLNPSGFGSTATEICSTNTVDNCANFDANTVPKDEWGIDSEGLDIDADGNFWISEEGGPTIWKVSPTGIVLKRYTPYALTQPEDVAINPCFAFRRNNRGFEGLTITPNGKVYAILQSPMYYGNASGTAGIKTLGNSRIHRILEIDPVTNNQKMYAYVNDGAIGTSSDIRPRDQKIGDLRAINNTTFLVIEQAFRGVQNVKKLYKIDITGATEVQSGLAYAGNSKTLEELDSPANLNSNGIIPVSKTLNFDMHANGWPTSIEKAEGITIIDANTIVLCNDNDYGQYSPSENGIATPNNQKSTLFKFSLQGANTLQGFVLSNNDFIVDAPRVKVYPNPFTNYIELTNVENQTIYELTSIHGKTIKKGIINSNHLDFEELANGMYLLKINNQTLKIIKN